MRERDLVTGMDPSGVGGFGRRPVTPLPDDAPVYVISVAAELSGLHPQTLRQYDRLGLVSPDRTPGRGRRYSVRDIEQLRQVQRLSQEDGVNLAGIKRILELENQVEALKTRVAELEMDIASGLAGVAAAGPGGGMETSLLPVPRIRPSTALVVWRPEKKYPPRQSRTSDTP